MISFLIYIINYLRKSVEEFFDDKFIEKLRARLTNHLRTKLIVLFLALLLWFYVVTEDEYTYVLNIPIRVTNLKPGKIIENDYPQEAKVLFYGKGKQLLGLMIENDIEMVINLSNVNENLAIKLKKENIPQHDIPVEPIRVIEPDSVKIILANLIQKKIPVKPDVTIHTIAGYTMVGKIEVQPDSVWINGPEGEVSKIDYASTEKVTFDEIKRSLSKKISLMPITTPNMRLMCQKVAVSANVQKLMEKVIMRVHVNVQNLPPGMRAIVIPPTMSLTVQGGVKVLAEVTEKEIQAYIDYQRKKKRNEIGYPAVIKTPPGVDIRNANPKTFKVVLERENNDNSRN